MNQAFPQHIDNFVREANESIVYIVHYGGLRKYDHYEKHL